MPSDRLVDRIAACRTIATIGICKNAGKTTVLNYLLAYHRGSCTLGITSIGYDGEEQDAVTLLPKPRIAVHPGMLIATADNCLRRTAAAYQVLEHTGIVTSLGEVRIVRALGCGHLEVSGPAISGQIKQIGDRLSDLGCDKVIVDGAAGRLSFAAHADGAILAVGAAMSVEMRQVVRQAGHVAKLLTLPACRRTDLVCAADRTFTAQSVDGTPYFVFRGAMVDRDLEHIASHTGGRTKVAVANDAAAIFITPRGYAKFVRHGGTILVKRQANLLALTINPMSPYGPWFDAPAFLAAMRQASQLPVFNIYNEKVNRDEQQVAYGQFVGQGLP